MNFHWQWSLGCLTVFVLAVTPLFARTPQGSTTQHFGPEAVWALPREVLAACLEKQPSSTDCLAKVMKQTGASPQAQAFSKLLDGEGYMQAFQPMGQVNLATVAFPMRANTNEAAVLIGGTPPLVSSELTITANAPLTLGSDPAYPALKRRFPDLEIWPTSAEFRAMKRLPGGGQRFEFAYPLLNGCHACALAGYALVALDFGQDGVYQGFRLIRLETAP